MAQEQALIRSDIEAYLQKYQDKDLLRFVAVGSVDDGKSTLIGRLLHDTGMVYEDQLNAVKKASSIEGEDIDFSLFTDGLAAEREQGITIDVAYRYFSTEKRKFIIADTPGHIQYTRNMVTGASTANVALILIDARLGVLQQSKRHAYIASLIGIPHLAVCVNKMDLVSYDQAVFERIRKNFSEFAQPLGFKDVSFFPISALKGVNIVKVSDKTPWSEQGTVLNYLETVPIAEDRNLEHFRLPVQTVLRPNLNYRGFAGQVASGVVVPGDRIVALPSGQSSTVKHIDTFEGEISEACAGQSVVIRLTDEIDVSRGDMLVHEQNLPAVDRKVQAHLVWMHERPLDTEKTYLLKHTTQTLRVQINQVLCRKNMDTLSEESAQTLQLNDIGKVEISAHRALFFDDYKVNRATGSFILIDSLNNATVAAGVISGAKSAQQVDEALGELRAGSALKPKTQISPAERLERMGQTGLVIWLTGLPGSGRWSLAYALERRLFDLGHTATVVDPSEETLASMISAAKACSDAGLITICAFSSQTRKQRQQARERLGERFFEVYVNTSRQLAQSRRPDADFQEFEEPHNPNITVALDSMRIDEAIKLIYKHIEQSAHTQFHNGR